MTTEEPTIIMFRKEKETKGTIRFKEVPTEGKPPIIGTLYVQKWFAGDATSAAVSIMLAK
jgi:hypothetical protein